jgi:quercetin dioxygenase-like cupin family protein
MKSIQKGCAWGLALAFAAAMALLAQNSGITRTVVKKGDVSVPGREAVIARVEIAPQASAGRHTHPGDEISYVTEGEGEILMEGKPPLKVKAGDGFVIPGGVKHDAHNTGAQPLRLIGVYVVEKGKPLATPAP